MACQKTKNIEKNLRNQKKQNENQSGISYRKVEWPKVLIIKVSLDNTGLLHI